MGQLSSQLTLVVSAYHAYSDFLACNIALLQKYWPDCEVEKICALDVETDAMKALLPFFDKVVVDETSVGGKNMLRVQKALELVKTPYVLLILDDFLLYDRIHNEDLSAMVAFAEAHNAGSISLIYKNSERQNFNAPSREAPVLKESPSDDPYRISLRSVFWKTEYVKKFADRYPSPSDFERLGSTYSLSLPETIYTVVRGREIYPNLDIIQRGKFRLNSTAFLRKEGLSYDTDRWPDLTWKDKAVITLRNRIYLLSPKLVTKLVAKAPWRKKY